MLALITAVTLGIVLALIFFALNYTRLLGGFGEQRTAVESAALIASQDLGRIVLSSDTMGFVSLSDHVPQAASGASLNLAKDGIAVPVHGLNTLIGTARVDMLIADKIGNKCMAALANYDLLCITNDVLPKLEAMMQDAILQSPSKNYTDINNTPVNVYADAQNAYTSNNIRMTGKSTYVPNSLKLTLGYSKTPSVTNIPLPVNNGQVTVDASGNSAVSANYCYLSNVHVPVTTSLCGNQIDYMFAAIGSAPSLSDPRNFVPVAAQANPPANMTFPLQFSSAQMPTIVQATATQTFYDNQNPTGNAVTASACAAPGAFLDPVPHPGDLQVAFPDGTIQPPTAADKFDSLVDILNSQALSKYPASTNTPYNGDYTNGTNGSILESSYLGQTPPSWWNANSADPFPLNNVPCYPASWSSSPTGQAPTVSDTCALAFYDWVRQAGVRADIGAINTVASAKYTLQDVLQDWKVYTSSTTQTGATTEDITTDYNGNPQICQGISYWYQFKQSGSTYAVTMVGEQPSGPMPYMSAAEGQFFAYSYGAYNPQSLPVLNLVSFLGGNVLPTKTWRGIHNLHIPGESILGLVAALLGTDNRVCAYPIWDVAVRSHVRNYGALPGFSSNPSGGAHGGSGIEDPDTNVFTTMGKSNVQIASKSPADAAGKFQLKGVDVGGQGRGALDNPLADAFGNGKGAHPVIGTQSDFDDQIPPESGSPWPTNYPFYLTFTPQPHYPAPSSNGLRPTYQIGAAVCQIRFRQELQATKKLLGLSSVTSTNSAVVSKGYFEDEIPLPLMP